MSLERRKRWDVYPGFIYPSLSPMMLVWSGSTISEARCVGEEEAHDDCGQQKSLDFFAYHHTRPIYFINLHRRIRNERELSDLAGTLWFRRANSTREEVRGKTEPGYALEQLAISGRKIGKSWVEGMIFYGLDLSCSTTADKHFCFSNLQRRR